MGNKITIIINDDTYFGLSGLARYLEIERGQVVEKLVKEKIKLLGDAVLGISPSLSPSPEPTADPEWANRYPASMLQPGWYQSDDSGSLSPSVTASCSAPPLPWYQEIWDLLTDDSGINARNKWRMIKIQIRNAWIDWKDSLTYRYK